jgi:hypothetical protein
VHIDELYQQKLHTNLHSNTNAAANWQAMQLKMKAAKRTKTLQKIGIAAGVLIVAGAFVISNVGKKETITNTANVATTNAQPTAVQPTTGIPQNIDKEKPTIVTNKAAVLEQPPTVSNTGNKPTSRVSPINAKATEQQEAGFYIDLSREPQLFEINANSGATIVAKQGTTINIPANAIVDNNGQLKNGTVTIVVQEYYRYNDDENTIPSAGMVKYNVYDGDTQYTISNKNQVTVKMKNDVASIKLVAADDMVPEKQLQQMTWATNEHFFADNRTKIDYKITLDKKYNANTFMSQLVFTDHKIVIPGNIENNSLLFVNVPVGEQVHFVSFGKTNNRYFSCSKKIITGNTRLNDFDFVEVSETRYNQLLEMYSKLAENK